MGLCGRFRRLSALATLPIVALVFAGCDWPMFGYDAALTGSSPDQAVNGANVSTLQQLFTNRNINKDAFGYPIESNGVVYVGETNGNLDAYDANGASNCSGTPNQCSPLWTGSTPGNGGTSAPAVANGVVYIVSSDGATLSAFDAAGATNCSGNPKVCQPLWTAPTTPGGAPRWWWPATSSTSVVTGP